MKNENWKLVNFKLEKDVKQNIKLYVSDQGRLKSEYKGSGDNNIITGSLSNGYLVFKSRFLKERTKEELEILEKYKAQALVTEKKIWKLKRENAPKNKIKELEDLWKKQRERNKKAFAATIKERTSFRTLMVHRLVAQYFLPKPLKSQTIVAHLNFNKQDNKVKNLKWVSQAEFDELLRKYRAKQEKLNK